MATPTEMQEYLKDWCWTEEPHPSGIVVYSHNRFPSKYKLETAYEKMKAAEPSLEPIRVFKNDEEGLAGLKEFMTEAGIIPPKLTGWVAELAEKVRRQDAAMIF